MLTSGKKLIHNQNGMAVLEMIPIMIIIVVLMNFAYGFFGVIHTGILNSIAARNYAFETFRHRSSLLYFRERSADDNNLDTYHSLHARYHGIASDRRNPSSTDPVATEREISFTEGFGNPDIKGLSPSVHLQEVLSIRDDGTRYNDKEGVNPVWIRPMYGLCLNAKCEAEGR